MVVAVVEVEVEVEVEQEKREDGEAVVRCPWSLYSTRSITNRRWTGL